MFTPSITPNQIRSMPSRSAAGPSSGMTMKAISKKSRKKASTKTKMLTKIRKPSWPPGIDDQHLLDPAVAVHAVEGQREHARADQDEDHEGGELGGRFHRLPGQIEGEAALHHGEDHRAGRAHGAALGRRRDADEDRAEHEEDQRERRHHHEGGLLGHDGDEAEAGHAFDQRRDQRIERAGRQRRQQDAPVLVVVRVELSTQRPAKATNSTAVT